MLIFQRLFNLKVMLWLANLDKIENREDYIHLWKGYKDPDLLILHLNLVFKDLNLLLKVKDIKLIKIIYKLALDLINTKD